MNHRLYFHLSNLIGLLFVVFATLFKTYQDILTVFGAIFIITATLIFIGVLLSGERW